MLLNTLQNSNNIINLTIVECKFGLTAASGNVLTDNKSNHSGM